VAPGSQGRREPQRGPGKHFCGARLGRKIFVLFFKIAHSSVPFYFCTTSGRSNVAGPGENSHSSLLVVSDGCHYTNLVHVVGVDS